MAKIGGALFEGNSKLWAGPLGVVQIGFNGYDLGKTTADTNLTPDQDIKDILYQQEGTKAADHVRTGQDYLLAATFGEIKTGLLVELMAGISSQNTDPNDDDGVVNRSIFQSMREQEGDGLRVIAVDADGVPSENDQDILQFYEAIPLIEGELVNWGADTQRNLPVNFRIKWHRFDTGESTTYNGAFGYWGDPTAEDVPAIEWQDVAAPELLSATITLATEMELVFDENIAFQTSFDAVHYICKLDGDFLAPTAGAISTTTLTLTFPAASFSGGNVAEIYVTENALEDTETVPNLYPGVDGFNVVNTL